MARKKTVEDMSSDELYALAQARAEEELERQREETRQMVEELRSKRRDVVAQHRKEIAAIDREIRKLSGKTKTRSGGRRAGVNVTDRVMQIVVNAGEISTKDIKAELENEGLNVSNLSQTLAYLKRQGKVSSPARSIYTPA